MNKTNNSVLNTPIVETFRLANHPVPAHYNQATMLSASRRLNPLTLRDSLRLLAAYHDMLRACWDGSRMLLRDVASAELVHFEEHDLAKCADVKAEVGRIGNALQASIDLANGPFLRAALFHLADRDAVLIVIHHLTVDGVSWRILVEDLNAVYAQLLEGSAGARLPKVLCTFPKYAEKLSEYAVGDDLAKELPYWAKVAETARAVPPLNGGGIPALCQLSVPAEVTKAFLTDAAVKFGVGANDLFLTALVRAWRTTTGRDELVVSLEGHGREPFGKEPLPLERVIGWFTTIYPVVLSAGDEPAAETLKRVSATLAEIPNKGFGYGSLKFLAGHGELDCPTQMTFNYLGSFEEGGETGKALFTIDHELPQGDAVARENCADLGFTINCFATARGLAGGFTYDTKVMDGKGGERFVSAFTNEIAALSRA